MMLVNKGRVDRSRDCNK